MAWNDGLDFGTPAYHIAASENQHLRVVAGPGAGKSFALKRRVARLLEIGVEPRNILPVTFTRVAAEDLHRELVGMDVQGCEQLQATTLHSLALKKLMRNHVLHITGRIPRPLNVFEIKPMEADLAHHGGVREVRRKINAHEAAWARLQQDVPGRVQNAEDETFSRDLVSWLKFHKAMLIGEVIPQFYNYLLLNPGAPERNEFTHILVDEYQDLNKAEQAVIDLLADNADICIVGDDDQSIYSFKYAHPDGIREWTEGKPDVEDLTLTECRRCPTRVVAMANSLIANNVHRIVPRRLIPRQENGPGEVLIIQYPTLEDEVRGIINKIIEIIEAGIDPGDILILAQRGVIGTPIYEELLANNIPTRSYYAEVELDAEEAQVRYAFLKLFVHRDDRVALRWLLGRGNNSWFARSYARIRLHCEQTGLALWEVLEQLTDGRLRIPYTSTLVEEFLAIKMQIRELELLEGLREVIDFLFPYDEESVQDLRKLAIDALEEVGIDDRIKFISELSASIAKPEIPSEVEEVRIMSLHKSKGLSAAVTIIAGCVEGLLPRQPDEGLPVPEQESQLEEQRRLFYVGMTRVKATPEEGKPGMLMLTYSRSMRTAEARRAHIRPAHQQYGNAMLHASRFIGELGPEAPNPLLN
jgi:DNA helicase II / ATP-dependent DNA helicase PcrA